MLVNAALNAFRPSVLKQHAADILQGIHSAGLHANLEDLLRVPWNRPL